MKSSKVFISYSHDSKEHMDRVLELADRLRDEGVDCRIDQTVKWPRKGWASWAEEQITDWAEFVLIVFTEGYHRRWKEDVEGESGRGVRWEGEIITQRLLESRNRDGKFVPVVFSEDSEDEAKHIFPSILLKAPRYNLNREGEYERLYRYLTDQPETPERPLGKLRPLPPRKRKQISFEPYDEVTGGDEERGNRHGTDEPGAGGGRRNNVPEKNLDRGTQVYRCRTVLKDHRLNKSSSPLVCIIHGDEYESHSVFRNRLREALIPEMFEKFAPGRAQEAAIVKYKMTWPQERLTEENHAWQLWKSLKVGAGFDESDPVDEVRKTVVEKRLATFIYLEINTRHWHDADLKQFDLFFKFWGGEEWQNLPEDFLLLICLCCSYKRKPEQGEWKSVTSNDDMRAYIESLKPHDYEGLYLAPIDELLGVECDDAKELVDDWEVEESSKILCDGYIEELYRKPELCSNGRIPMSLLLPHLVRIKTTKCMASEGG